MANIKYNVGVIKGATFNTNLYELTTTGGVRFLGYKKDIGSAVYKMLFMPKSVLIAKMALGEIALGNAVKPDDYAEVIPTGQADSNGYITLDNEPGTQVEPLFTNQALYSLKGTGVAAYEGTDLGSRTGLEGSKSAGTVVVNQASAKTLTETLNEGVTWVTKNPLILAGILFLGSELLGFTSIMGLKKGKKKAFARRRR
jgi:hypothetical protein